MEVLVELLFTFLRVLVIEFLVGTVFYWIGWTVCKVATLGSYPRSLQLTNHNKRDTRIFVVGFAVSLAIFLLCIYWG
jgi:hypothetical protein